ncbi:MAG: hypothetical protein JW809_09690 [Pirellulales bacterium]|nr:hypothetical protein [Pirellulales bacterium]
MSHPLETRIAKFRGRLRRLLLARGLGRLVAVAVAALLVLGGVDYLVRFEDRGLRIILTLALVAVLARTCHRYVYRGWTLPLGEVDLARRLERHFPELAGDLASSLEFLRQPRDDPKAGSAGLRRAVIAQTVARADSVDFARAIDRRPVVRAATAAVGAVLLAAIVAALAPVSCQVAVARLAYPWGEMAWPRTHYLRLANHVDRVARGDAFEIEVVDAFGAPLPAGGRIHYRIENPDGTLEETTEPMRRLGDVLVARRENVARPFSFRVEGGDDHSMPWNPVAVVEPPAVVSLRALLAPPAYTGLAPHTVEGDVNVLAGTAVRFEATATKPLASAELRLSTGPTIPAAIDPDGVTLRVPGEGVEPLVIDEPVEFRLVLTDREGLTAGQGRPYAIQVRPDTAPTVGVEQPSGTRFVTPQAIVPLAVVAKDDLAVARVDLEAASGAQPPTGPAPWRIALFEGPASLDPATAAEARGTRQIDFRWDLAALGPEKLSPGMQVSYRAVAADYRGASGKSPWQQLIAITPEELVDRLGRQQRFILAELARGLNLARTSRQQLARLQIRLEELGRLDQLEVDQLRGAELNQREAASTLADREQGVPAHVQSVLADLANNRVDSPELVRRMSGLNDELSRLGAGPLAEIARRLTTAVKSAQVRLDERAGDAAPDAATRAAVTAAADAQDHVIETVQRLLAELTEWDNYRQFRRDVGQLLRDQRALAKDAAALGRETLGRETRSLTPRQIARLRTLAQDQLELARRLERILYEMDLTAGHLADRDPLAAQTLTDALDRARRQGTVATMRTAGDETEKNRIAQASDHQQQAIGDLEDLLNVLANRPENELARLGKKLDEAQADLAELAQQQESLRARIEPVAAQADAARRREQLTELAARQDALRAEAERMTRRLAQLLADEAARQTQTATRKMGQAGQSARADDAARAAAGAAEAKSALDAAGKALAQRRQEVEAELAMRQLAKLEESIKALRGRQLAAVEEAQRLAGLRAVQGRLTEGQTTSLHELARAQSLLGEDTARLAQEVDEAGVFRWTMDEAAEAMSRAAGWLGRRETGQPAQAAQHDALARLDLAIEALKPEPPEANPSSSAAGGSPGKGPSPPSAQGIPPVAQLKLLRLLQQGLNRRTQAWQRAYGGNPNPPDDARRLFERLSHEQGRLADFVLQWLQTAPAPETEPLKEER